MYVISIGGQNRTRYEIAQSCSHTQRDTNNDGVRWSHALLALPFIVILLFFGSYKQTLIPLWNSVVTFLCPYCFSCPLPLQFY